MIHQIYNFDNISKPTKNSEEPLGESKTKNSATPTEPKKQNKKRFFFSFSTLN
jgi:hypothetical protein